MNLIIDTGNTFTKLALFQGREMVAFSSFEGVDEKQIIKFCELNLSIKNAILSSVKAYPSGIDAYLNDHYFTVLFSHTTSIPVINKYGTPETLGKDRLAGVVGAQKILPANDILVIDAGTAITYDFITASGEYMGGAISPGIAMRYKALNTYTDRLPLLNYYEEVQLTGNDTYTSIYSGVLNGAVAEMEGIIQQYRNLYPGIKIIITGGDHNYFDKRLKIKTFAAPNLVLEGLNLILDFNIETH
ncbi:MAG: type III pantothenate kinase [Bacteroidales bacterium]|nr:type III pantothenate kinase [Bacteroidales bacterium]